MFLTKIICAYFATGNTSACVFAGFEYLGTEAIPVGELVRFIRAKRLRHDRFDVNDVCRTAASSL